MEVINQELQEEIKRQLKLQIDLIESLNEMITDPDDKSIWSLEKRMIVSQGKHLLNLLDKS